MGDVCVFSSARYRTGASSLAIAKQSHLPETVPLAVKLNATRSIGVVLSVVATGLYFLWLMFW